MENSILNRINKLKQDLTSTNKKTPESCDDFTAYLSQSIKKSESPEQLSIASSQIRKLLEERQLRITELEDEVSYLRESAKNREGDLIAKYEKAIESIKANCDKIVDFYESQFSTLTILQDKGSLEGILENIKSLETENQELKARIKAHQAYFQKEKLLLEQEISVLKDKYNIIIEEGKLEKIDESIEIKELKHIKDKLEKEIASLQRNKTEFLNEIVGNYEEKCAKAVKSAQVWKNKFEQLGFRFFSSLRSIRIELFKIKDEVLINFEDAITSASSTMMKLHRKYKTV